MCVPCVAYEEPAAMTDPMAPASEMPSCSSCPDSDSLYDSMRLRSTASYVWPNGE